MCKYQLTHFLWWKALHVNVWLTVCLTTYTLYKIWFAHIFGKCILYFTFFTCWSFLGLPVLKSDFRFTVLQNDFSLKSVLFMVFLSVSLYNAVSGALHITAHTWVSCLLALTLYYSESRIGVCFCLGPLFPIFKYIESPYLIMKICSNKLQ
jgi:hypothetical protein